MRESWSVHLLHSRGASVVAQGDALSGAAGSVMVVATLKQGSKSMYSNTSGYVHMWLRLDWGKGITGQ